MRFKLLDILESECHFCSSLGDDVKSTRLYLNDYITILKWWPFRISKYFYRNLKDKYKYKKSEKVRSINMRSQEVNT